MQDPNEDTEWNDALRAKGILPPKQEATIDEDTVLQVSTHMQLWWALTRDGIIRHVLSVSGDGM